MDLEETKKIILNKIEADEAAREFRSHIKSYIHEKQNLREGFTETFKPLIETSEKVKTSIDTQQNKLIEQLQNNQLALTAVVVIMFLLTQISHTHPYKTLVIISVILYHLQPSLFPVSFPLS